MAAFFREKKSEGASKGAMREDVMSRSLVICLGIIFFLVQTSPCRSSCSDDIWNTVRYAFTSGNGRTIGRLVGDGTVSLRLDGISQGRYTADQTAHLMQQFFDRTEECELSLEACGSRGNRSWAEGTLRYTFEESKRTVLEHILLEFCFDDNTERYLLCSIRSVTR